MNKSFKQSFNIYSKLTNPTRTFTTRTINMQNNAGQGASHATGGSHVPESVQKKAPAGLEESLPNPVSNFLHLVVSWSNFANDRISFTTPQAPMARILKERVSATL
jgi:hypothetical protein